MTDSKVNVTGFHVVLEITEYGTRAKAPGSLFGVATTQETSRTLLTLEVDVDTVTEARDAIYRNVYAALPYTEEELSEPSEGESEDSYVVTGDGLDEDPTTTPTTAHGPAWYTAGAMDPQPFPQPVPAVDDAADSQVTGESTNG